MTTSDLENGIPGTSSSTQPQANTVSHGNFFPNMSGSFLCTSFQFKPTLDIPKIWSNIFVLF